MPEISIIVPNYNTAKYLPRCLDSLIHQTFQDIEILVIDDGSTDNSIEILKGYKDPRIHIFYHQGDGFGPGGARNIGLDNASGKYVMFCDSDDWYELDMCQKMYDAIEREQVDVACCHHFLDDEEKLPIEEKASRHKDLSWWKILTGKFILTDDRILKTNVVLWNKIWRRDLIQKYQIRFLQKNEHDDDAFWYMYGVSSITIYFLSEKLYHYFLRSNSIMSSAFQKKPKNPNNRFEVCMGVFKFLYQHQIIEKHKKLILRLFENEMKNTISFMPLSDIEKKCDDLNIIIKNQLKSKKYLKAVPEGVFLIDKNIKSRLWINFCIFSFKKYFYSLIKNIKYKKYENRVQNIRAALKRF